MTALETFSLDDLELVSVTQSDSEMGVSVNVPFSPAFPATGMELEGGHTVVYFGTELGTHTDGPEELVVCLDGDDVEARAGDATGVISAGDVAVIPAMAPHGFRNTGDVTARFRGVFSDSTTVSEFEADLEPFGERIVKT